MKKICGLLALLLFVTLSAPVAAADGDGIISGRVINDTSDGSPVGVLEVALDFHVSDAHSSEEPVIVNSDSEGNFEFRGLNTAELYTYHVSVDYQDVRYYSSAISFTNGQTEINTGVIVYDTTNSSEEINISMSHTVIYVEDDGLTFVELLYINNTGDHTYTGSQELPDNTSFTLVLPMSPDAEHFHPEMGITENEYVITGDGLFYTAPIKPGSILISYSYCVHDFTSDYTFERTVEFSQSAYEFLVHGAGGVNVPELSRNEPLVLQGVSYEYFTGKNIPPGQTLTLQLSGLIPEEERQTMLWLIIPAVLLVAVLLLALNRRSKSPGAPVKKGEDKLLAQIASLDDAFGNGDIDEDEYQWQRKELMNRVIKARQQADNKRQEN